MPLLVLAAVLVPTRVHHAPTIDGKLNDWHAIASTEAFTQSFPHDGAAPTETTRLAVTYDDANVYIAIDCPQKARSIARLTRRDRTTEDDRIEIDLDTAHDRRSAFHFEISSAGVLVDGLRYGDTELSTDWDDIWRAEVSHSADGWSAELAIPLRLLRLHDGVTTWGLQVRRWVAAIGEEDIWAYSPRDAGGEVSRYGDIGPFEGLAPRGSLALVPFVLGKLTRRDDLARTTHDADASAGLDLTWRPAPSITLQGAIRPDFGQVEADQLVINLTTTEVEYPEKRPFFLQGMDLFQTPIQQLYTRRIGGDIDAAAKLISSAGPVDVGALSVVTADAAHHVVRVRGTGGGLTLGALATAQQQRVDEATSGGIDGAWRSPEGTFLASGQLVATQVINGAPVTRPDGTVMRSGDTGIGGTFHLAKEGGWLRGLVDYEGYSRRFDIDHLGYQPRANVHHLQVEGELFSAKPAGPFLEERTRVEAFFRRNMDGLVLPSGYQWNVGATTKNFWDLWMELHWRPAYFDDRELGDGRALQRSGALGLELEINTDARKSLVVGGWTSTHALHAGWDHETDAFVKIRPRANIEIELDPYLLFTRGEPRYLGEDNRFARQDASSVGLTTRVIWTLQRDLTLQAYVQALLASIHYRDPLQSDPMQRVIPIDALIPAGFDASHYDGREGALDATIVGRWEYRPGSTAFLVYSHAQTPAEGAGFEPRALVRGPSADAVLLKLSWAYLR
ncbi:MAG: hypothetical protein JO257_22445 [Deltaproteobacteria bacterium]|nr:hypothetical protein [Deltaproteobacteria bacterium]